MPQPVKDPTRDRRRSVGFSIVAGVAGVQPGLQERLLLRIALCLQIPGELRAGHEQRATVRQPGLHSQPFGRIEGGVLRRLLSKRPHDHVVAIQRDAPGPDGFVAGAVDRTTDNGLGRGREKVMPCAARVLPLPRPPVVGVHEEHPRQRIRRGGGVDIGRLTLGRAGEGRHPHIDGLSFGKAAEHVLGPGLEYGVGAIPDPTVGGDPHPVALRAVHRVPRDGEGPVAGVLNHLQHGRHRTREPAQIGSEGLHGSIGKITRGARIVHVVLQDRKHVAVPVVAMVQHARERDDAGERSGLRIHAPVSVAAGHPVADGADHAGDREGALPGLPRRAFQHCQDEFGRGCRGDDVVVGETGSVGKCHVARLDPECVQQREHRLLAAGVAAVIRDGPAYVPREQVGHLVVAVHVDGMTDDAKRWRFPHSELDPARGGEAGRRRGISHGDPAVFQGLCHHVEGRGTVVRRGVSSD